MKDVIQLHFINSQKPSIKGTLISLCRDKNTNLTKLKMRNSNNEVIEFDSVELKGCRLVYHESGNLSGVEIPKNLKKGQQ